MFSDFFLCVDFDRTLTAVDGSIPRRNVEAIRYFMENGGTFTVNTGRTYVSFRPFLEQVPINAPLLLMNGSGCYDDGKLVNFAPLEVDVWPIVRQLREHYPEVNLELQALDLHYLVEPTEAYLAYYKKRGVPCKNAEPAVDQGPFLKIGIYGDTEHREEGSNSAARAAMFDRMEEELNRLLGGQLVVLRATPQIINIHAPGASKLSAARRVQQQLGKKYLVCVGDEGNDMDMLQGADYAFCPSDGAVADQFPNVCPCTEGAVADVIYHKIPELLKG